MLSMLLLKVFGICFTITNDAHGAVTYSISYYTRLDYVWSTKPTPFTHIAKYAANQTWKTGRTPSLFDKCTGFFYVRLCTPHGTSGLTSHHDSQVGLILDIEHSHRFLQRILMLLLYQITKLFYKVNIHCTNLFNIVISN